MRQFFFYDILCKGSFYHIMP